MVRGRRARFFRLFRFSILHISPGPLPPPPPPCQLPRDSLYPKVKVNLMFLYRTVFLPSALVSCVYDSRHTVARDGHSAWICIKGLMELSHMPPLACRHVLICHSAPLTLNSYLHRGHDGIAEHAGRDRLGAGRRDVASEDAAEDGLIHRGFDGGGRRLLAKRIAQHHRAA